jgi:UDP-glucuronate 4-epimerase
MNKILVTGAAGFIGSTLSEQLIKNKFKVIGVDNFDSFYPREVKETNISFLKLSPEFTFYEADIRNISTLEIIFSSEKPDIIIHLAAKAGIRPSLEYPQTYYDVNVMGTLNILEMMRKFKIRKMIFGSSSSVYGNNKNIPFSENDNVDNPISPYAASKKAGELLCHTYHHLYDFDIFCLRFFTVYGPRQRPDLAIHKFTKLIMEGKPLPFYGDGSTERDYTYIDDVVDGILSAMYNLKGYDIFNIGESKTISLTKMVATLENILGKKAILETLPMQPGDVEKTYADVSKAKQALGYNPTFSFENGIKEFVDWYSKTYAKYKLNENTSYNQ